MEEPEEAVTWFSCSTGGEKRREDVPMTTFVMKGKLSATALRHISSGRTVKAKEIIQQSGGRFVSAYATLGDSDVLLIAEFPGVPEAMTASIALNKALDIAFATVPALGVDEFDKLAGGGA